MKILVICQYYYPEPFRINDLCEEMVRRGHEVTVVTGEPNYPEGEIYTGYENHKHVDEIVNGVKVHRCPIIPRKKGTMHRLLNYFSYPILAKKYIKKTFSEERPFDIVFVNQLSPVMMAEPAILYKKKYGTPIVMYCLDLWPESLVAGGVKRKSVVYLLFHKISKKIYRNMDRILITSRMFRDYLKDEFGIENRRIEYLPQYAEGIFEQLPYKEDVSKIEITIRDKPFCFHIVGGGTDLERLQNMATGLKNVVFYGRRPLDEMPKYYANADAMIVSLKADPVLSLTLPGKVQSYMAVGKPIIGAINGETSEVIKEAKCGYCGRAENIEDLTNNIVAFANSKHKKDFGTNARRYYDNNFSKQEFMNKLELEFEI